MTVDQKPLSNIVKTFTSMGTLMQQTVVIHHHMMESQLKLVIAQLICAIHSIQTVQTIQKIRIIQKIQAM